MSRILPLVAILAIGSTAVLLAGCSQHPTGPIVEIAFSSPSQGEHIVGTTTVTVSGTLSGAAVTGFSVEVNGAAVQSTYTNTDFEASVTLTGNANTVTVTADSVNGPNTATLQLYYYPYFLDLSTFQQAGYVFGQADLTTGVQSSTVDDAHFGLTFGDPTFVGGALYLPDTNNNRVLGFDATDLSSLVSTLGSLPSADFLLGQSAPGTASDAFHNPQTVRAANGRFIVNDMYNNRVLVFDSYPASSTASASAVVGQSDFSASGHACTATGLNGNESAFAVGDKLIVADSGNNRVLIYDSIPTQLGTTSADLVLGQRDFTHCSKNDGYQDNPYGPTARTLYHPTDVWSNGTKLVVADANNNRVLIWNRFPTSNFQPADVVVGQTGMTGFVPAAAADRMDYPYMLTSTGSQLFVADAHNNRVLVYNTFPATNGASADVVLGQASFTTAAANDDNQDGHPDSGPTGRTLAFPSGIAVYPGGLIVADADNYRYLAFTP
ncbi:MAG: hypothetical protein P8Y02_00865 [Deinococcales bacterium]|jgi:hypothetical protein